eukprot:scaffold224224_cov28-Tisochrysis_lutea.AAC.8
MQAWHTQATAEAAGTGVAANARAAVRSVADAAARTPFASRCRLARNHRHVGGRLLAGAGICCCPIKRSGPPQPTRNPAPQPTSASRGRWRAIGNHVGTLARGGRGCGRAAHQRAASRGAPTASTDAQRAPTAS